MTKLIRWDNGETIHETDGDIRATVEAAAKLGISCFRANLRDANLSYADLRDANLRDANLSYADLRYADLRDANLRYADLRDANLRDANLRDANLSYADLRDANLRDANLRDANLRDANLSSAHLPIYCRWSVTYTLTPELLVHIGCKSKSIADWDAWFAGSYEYDTPRDSDDFKRIRANYMAVRAYLAAMGYVT